MDVFDDSKSCFRLIYVSIVAATGLPEMMFFATLVDTCLSKERITILTHPGKRFFRNWLFDGLKDRVNLIIRIARTEEEMHMLRHNDVRAQIELMLLAGMFQGVNK